MPGDIQDPAHCRAIVERAVRDLGGVDILVNNAAHQATFKAVEEISDEEWDVTFRINIHAMFYLTKAAVPHMRRGQLDHQHDLGQRRHAEPGAARLRDHQGRDPELHRRPRPAASPRRASA